MLLGCIADDFTGASDLANTLAKEGMATIQYMNVPSAPASADCEAGVVSLKTRTTPAAEAIKQSLAALEWLLQQGCQQIIFKYCSTFDSTPQGNIGPVMEALMERLGQDLAIACPAFPATGRVVFNGHLFVNGRLLSETGMKSHPLTPMTDPDIVRCLQKQSRGNVGLINYAAVRSGIVIIGEALRHAQEHGQNLVVVDATTDDDLRSIGTATAHHKLITGGSGIALGLPQNFKNRGLLTGQSLPFRGLAGAGVVLSGSCSTQSLSQVAAYARNHPSLPIFPGDLIKGQMSVAKAFQWIMENIEDTPMVYSTADTAAVQRAQERFGREKAAGVIERFMAELAHQLVEAGITRLVVGGGETSGAVVSALKIDACIIGPEIDPGIPAISVQGQTLNLALKSGNFGDTDFFEKALTALAGVAWERGNG
ncbi:MAG: 3-oxo-tetronate kinase [Beijerinckiaceae bacterium]